MKRNRYLKTRGAWIVVYEHITNGKTKNRKNGKEEISDINFDQWNRPRDQFCNSSIVYSIYCYYKWFDGTKVRHFFETTKYFRKNLHDKRKNAIFAH